MYTVVNNETKVSKVIKEPSTVARYMGISRFKFVNNFTGNGCVIGNYTIYYDPNPMDKSLRGGGNNKNYQINFRR
ncbi:hypothetical protein EBU91_02660 [bacterium]|nr:hypothetical protein [bacterium]